MNLKYECHLPFLALKSFFAICWFMVSIVNKNCIEICKCNISRN